MKTSSNYWTPLKHLKRYAVFEHHSTYRNSKKGGSVYKPSGSSGWHVYMYSLKLCLWTTGVFLLSVRWDATCIPSQGSPQH